MKPTLAAVYPVLMVSDVEASIRFYQRLGFAAVFRDAPNHPKYAGVRRDDVVLHLQWHDISAFSDGDRPTYRFLVADVDALSEEFAHPPGALDRTDIRDTPWGTREFHVRDPDRNGLQFFRMA